MGVRTTDSLLVPVRCERRSRRAAPRVVASAFFGTLVAALAGVVAASPLSLPGAARLAALDCTRVSAADVAEVLSRAPAPRIIALHGSVPFVTMEPFAEFLVAMGYPDERLRNPVDGARTYRSFVDSRRLAGEIAWHYERDGLMPMLIGHSQGGMVVIKVLHDLAGGEALSIPVWNPARAEPESRTAIVDPRDGIDATGRGPQARFRGGACHRLAAPRPARPMGRAAVAARRSRFGGRVHGIRHPLGSDCRDGSRAGRLPRDRYGAGAQCRAARRLQSHRPARDIPPRPAARDAWWVDAWWLDAAPEMPKDVDVTDLLHAADLWYSVRRHWCEGAKAFARAATNRASR